MAIRRFLGVTEAEMEANWDPSEPVAWMGCHFSPESGLFCGFPQILPPGSVLTLQDSTPILGCHTGTVCVQLSRAVSQLSCSALLLDFQRPPTSESADLAAALTDALPCPVILPPSLAQGLDAPVFLPPLPPDQPLGEYLAPWAGREVWLELAADGLELTLTSRGAARKPLPFAPTLPASHRDGKLHCHYCIQPGREEVRFTLWRTREDMLSLAEEAETLGVTACVGLWQELG